MSPKPIASYAEGRWVSPGAHAQPALSAIDGAAVGLIGDAGLDLAAMLAYARRVGGPALRRLTFPQRAAMLKAAAEALTARKAELYGLSYLTGATKADSWIDIDGGIGVLGLYQAKGRRELPDDVLILDGEVETLSRGGTFQGRHVWTSRQGAALHINAFNFPVWGMLEKLAPTLLAGVPAIVKPASATAYLAEAAFRILIEAQVFPEGALQLVSGPLEGAFEHLTGQDTVSFTGSAETAAKLKAHPAIAREGVRFLAEQDSLNATVLGPEAAPDSPEFALFVAEIVREMTVKAGQKCTAIRRALAPAHLMDAVQAALAERLAAVRVGDPRAEGVQMGPLVSLAQRRDVEAKLGELSRAAQRVAYDAAPVEGVDPAKGGFVHPVLLRCDAPLAPKAAAVHEVEAFGPVATLMPYRDAEDAIAIANRGRGSLVMSVFTHDPDFARDMALGAGAFHGRLAFIDRDSGKESTGHGSPLPHLVHGGPGRAGGGEEMGGLRGLEAYMQRSALQGSPRMLTAITRRYVPGAPPAPAEVHPFRLKFHELAIGYQLTTREREISLEDIEHFARFTGDLFYAHMDEAAAAANPLFGGRVAHGYLILSFAAGLFVDPAPGPVLANYGLDTLRFVKPVKPGEAISVRLTVKDKALRRPDQGEVRWDVKVVNRAGEVVASYDLLTMNAA